LCTPILGLTIKDQCLAAVDDHHAEALAFLTKLRQIELSRPDIVVGALAEAALYVCILVSLIVFGSK
jgi:hypothetical protein